MINKQPTLENVATGDLVKELNKRGHCPEDKKAEQIISFVARRYEIDRATVLLKNTNAKQVAAYLIRKCTSLTWEDISHTLGYGDHTGAVHAAKQGRGIYSNNVDLEVWKDYDEKKEIAELDPNV
jgi:chromosomal replication initiation ATPase DnaA